MPSYKAPLEDVGFLLDDVFHFDRYNNLPGFAPSGLTQISLVNAAWRAPAVAGVRRASNSGPGSGR